MILSDDITITAITGEPLREYTVQWTPDNSLVANTPDVGGGGALVPGPGNQYPGQPYPYPQNISTFKFEVFKDSFLAVGKDIEQNDARVAWYKGAGEEWELVS